MSNAEMKNLVGTVIIRKKDGVRGEVSSINESGKYVITLESGEEKIASASTVERHWKVAETEENENTAAKEKPAAEEKQAAEEETETPEEKATREKAEKEAKAKAKAEEKEKAAKEKAELYERLQKLKARIIAEVESAEVEGITRKDDKKYSHFKIGKTGIIDITVLSKAVKFFVLDIDGIDDEQGVFGTSLVAKHGPKAWKVGWGFKVTPQTSFAEIKVIVEKAIEEAVKVENERLEALDEKAKKAKEEKAEKAAKEENKEK